MFPTVAVSSFHGLTGWVDEARPAMTRAPKCFSGSLLVACRVVGPGRHAKFNPNMRRWWRAPEDRRCQHFDRTLDGCRVWLAKHRHKQHFEDEFVLTARHEVPCDWFRRKSFRLQLVFQEQFGADKQDLARYRVESACFAMHFKTA